MIALLSVPSAAFCADPGLAEALAHAKEGRTQKALGLLRALLRKEPGNNLLRFNYANTLFLEGKLAEAAESYRMVAASPSPLSLPASLYLARSLRRLGNTAGAAEALRALEGKELPPALARAVAEENAALPPGKMSEAALEAIRAGRFEEAARVLRTEAARSPRADLELALALAELKLGRTREAEAALHRALALSPPPELEASARALLLQLREGSWSPERAFLPEASVAAGYDSNYYGDADNSFETPTGKATLQLAGGARHVLRERKNTLWQNRYTLGWEGPTSPSGDRIFSYGAETELVLAGKLGQLAPAIRFDHFFISGDTYYYQPSVSLRARRLLADLELGLDYIFARPTATQPAYGFVSGPVHESSASLSRRAGSATYGLGLHYQYAGSGDLSSGTDLVPLRHHGFGPSLFWRALLRARWELYARLSYRYRSYATPAQPGGTRRRDHWKGASLQAEYSLGAGWRATLGASAAFNASTLGPGAPDDKNYSQLAAQGGLAWSLE